MAGGGSAQMKSGNYLFIMESINFVIITILFVRLVIFLIFKTVFENLIL